MNEIPGIEQDAAAPNRLRASGAWTLSAHAALHELTRSHAWPAATDAQLDLSGLTALDTAGAYALIGWVGPDRWLQAIDASTVRQAQQALLSTVHAAIGTMGHSALPRVRDGLDSLESIGRNVLGLHGTVMGLLGFIGLTLEALGRTIWRPKRWRITPLVAQIEQVGLNAVPLVLLLTFLVGCVVAFLGSTVLSDFGANQFVVHLISFSFLREFGVLLTAILMAGRTASAFTAQIGSMKANEEIDALRTLGLDPIEILVLPRLLAMVISLPLLSFLAMVSGIVGGALVSVTSLGLSPNLFLSILQNDIAVRHLFVGLGKAPVFAVLIALVGCLEGFKAGGSARSVGEHTTSAVVQSIFLVIVVNAVAALFFMEMNW